MLYTLACFFFVRLAVPIPFAFAKHQNDTWTLALSVARDML